MEKMNESSNAQAWELEVTCKNKEILTEVVNAIMSFNVIDFSVDNVDIDGENSRYLVFMSCSWFNNLKLLCDKLAEIEERLG